MTTEATTPAKREVPWRALSIGLGVTVVIVIAVVLASLYQPSPSGQAATSYAPQIEFGNLRVSAAETMMAGSVTYVDGSVRNKGDRTVTALTVTMTFHDVMGQIVQTEKTAIVTDKTGPLQPNSIRPFRVGFDHISAEWNQAVPNLAVSAVYVK